jgi:hypothetical protein
MAPMGSFVRRVVADGAARSAPTPDVIAHRSDLFAVACRAVGGGGP